MHSPELPVDSAMLDGEVVSLDERGSLELPEAAKLAENRRRSIARLLRIRFAVPERLRSHRMFRSLNEKQLLARLLLSDNPNNDGVIRYSDHIHGQGANVLQQACDKGMEGIVAKRADGVYHQFRSPRLAQSKMHQTARVCHRRLFEAGGLARRVRGAAARLLRQGRLAFTPVAWALVLLRNRSSS